MADGDTVAEKIADIAASKAAIAQAISAKGVAVPDAAKLADLAPLVGQISGGGGSGAADIIAIDRNTATELVIPAGTTKIGDYAFYNCLALTSLTVPYGVTKIGNYAFYNCQNLSSLSLPATLASIGQSAFYGIRGEVTFQKTKAAVSAMENYPWDLFSYSPTVIHCTDGDLTA